MDVDLLTALVGAAVALLGTEVVKRLATAGADRETSAQEAIIGLAQSAMEGWLEESKSVGALTEVLRQHDENIGMQLDGVRVRSEGAGERLVRMGDQMSALFSVLAERENGRE